MVWTLRTWPGAQRGLCFSWGPTVSFGQLPSPPLPVSPLGLGALRRQQAGFPWGRVLPPCSHPLCPADLLEARRPLAHEYLGETLRVMRQVISKYPLLNTVETLTAAGSLIAKIRGQPAPGRALMTLGAPGGLPGGRDI